MTNFRDVAGSGLPLPGGRTMTTGVVFRSGKLATLSDADRERLVAAGVTDVIDLRTPAVAKASPDPVIEGAADHSVNIFAVYSTASPPKSSAEVARAFMRQRNIDFVANPAQRARIAEVLTLIAAAKGPVIIHCTEGKDRTGWVAAVLQLIAGASRDQVIAEYLHSNERRAALIKKSYAAALARLGPDAAEARAALLTVERGYLVAGLDRMDTQYGGLAGYLSQGLGLSEETVTALRERLG